ncbi:MAG TPA: hypothetical protein VEZ70_04220 [Allosphingosinicella sp.]|nr:hypothetical protein [Allosphingosinicella sp.]
MTWYRLYRWSDKGITQAWELQAEDEPRAIAQATERLEGARGELWQEKTLVRRFTEAP